MKKKIQYKKFRSKKFLFKECEKILVDEIKRNKNIMITGGKTYLNFYKKLNKIKNFNKINFFLSDERLSRNKNDLNSYHIKKSLNYESNKINNINFFFDINDYKNKNRYLLFKKIEKNFRKLNSKINLAFLGVGDDGHIASIFNKNNKAYYMSKLFILSKNSYDKFYRLSFSYSYLKKINNIIFVLFEKNKKFLLNKNKKVSKTVFFNFLKKRKLNTKVFYV